MKIRNGWMQIDPKNEVFIGERPVFNPITFSGVYERRWIQRQWDRIDRWYCRHLYFPLANAGWYFRNLGRAIIGRRPYD